MHAEARTESVEIEPFELHAVQPVLRVRDVAATVEWYRSVLGFTVDFVWGDPVEHARVSAVDARSRTGIQFTNGLAEGTDTRACGWTMIHVGRDIDALYEVWQSRGVEIVHPIGTRSWGMRDFDIADINGYVLRFAAEA